MQWLTSTLASQNEWVVTLRRLLRFGSLFWRDSALSHNTDRKTGKILSESVTASIHNDDQGDPLPQQGHGSVINRLQRFCRPKEVRTYHPLHFSMQVT